jgi:DNA-binding HxlR family transcriptional regulator
VRFNALARVPGSFRPRVSSFVLRGLQVEGLVRRRVAGTVPPQVTYGLTMDGPAPVRIILAFGQWAETQRATPSGAAP